MTPIRYWAPKSIEASTERLHGDFEPWNGRPDMMRRLSFVLGQNPILHTLEEAVNGETIEDRKLIVRPVADISQVNNCQILSVGSSDRKYLRSLLRDLKT